MTAGIAIQEEVRMIQMTMIMMEKTLIPRVGVTRSILVKDVNVFLREIRKTGVL